MHSQGWTRERALGFLRGNSALGDTVAAYWVDRCIGEPGSALAAYFGARGLETLRAAAGSRVNDEAGLQALNLAMLDGGWLPLPVLVARARERARIGDQ
jgi:uncharacterized protein (DUF885 family)